MEIEILVGTQIFGLNQMKKLIPDIEAMQDMLVAEGCSIGGYDAYDNQIQVWNSHSQDELIDATLEGVQEYIKS
jgi:hypothetical protein